MSRLYALSLTILLLLAASVAAQTAPPVLDPIGAQTTDENVNLSFGVTASDADLTTPVLSTSTLPTGATFTDNLDGTGSFSWTPDYTQSGSYSVTFYAADAATADIDSEIVSITVNNVNQDPVLAAIGAQSTTENVLLSFGVSATDADGQALTLTTSTLPTGASFTDNGDGTGSFSWTPTYLQSGSYSVTFRAGDGVATDSEIVAITVVEAGNQPPVLDAIGAQSTTENVLLSFTVSATDVESTPSFTTSTLPTGASFTDNGDGTGSFSWTPDYLQSGSYSVIFRAVDDSSAVDSEVVAITVLEAGNQLPVLASIGAQSTDENVLLTFGVSATDIESTPVLSTSTLPTGASFTDNLDGTGSFSWTPDYTQAGSYDVTFYATDDSAAVDSEIVSITVNNVNQDPVLAAIGSKSIDENVLLSFAVSAGDPDGTIPTLTTSTLPTGATFTDNLDGTGSFSWTPTYDQAGSYDVTFRASDGVAVDSEIVTITVNNVNQDPVLAAIGAQSTDENTLLSFGVSASDPDGTTPSLTTSTLPTGATFTDNGDGTGSFNWTPDYTQSGSYDVTFRAEDGVAVDSEVVTITVNNVNQLPVLAAIGSKSTAETVNLNFNVSASDADGTTPVLTTSTLPTGATFTDNLNGTGTFDWTPGLDQSGSYSVTFYATDAAVPTAVDSEVVSINVTETNQAPVLAAIGAQSTDENTLLSFGVSASDPDGTTPTLTTSTLPTGATFTDNLDGTGTFSWTPTFDQAGTYDVTFRAEDGVAVDSEIVTITVNNVNQEPVLTAIGSQSTTENVLLSFGVSASDGDGQALTLTTSTLPTGASFTDNGDGTGSFSWTPTYLQSGSYSVTFRATDGVATDSEVVAITVIEAGNQLPVLASIGSQSTTENVLLSFTVSATDVESTPSFTTSTLPTGATFTDNGDGTGSFSWTPDYLQSGSYSVTFRAVDDSSAVDSEVVAITVLEAGNQLPVLASIGSQSTTEDVLLSFGVSATDIESTPTLTTSSLPTGASFSDNGDGTGSFNWTPDFTQAGIYDVTFYATDDSAAVDSEIVTITVNDAGNQAPVLASIGSQSTAENVLLSFGVSATDGDGTTPTLSTSTLPTGATFTDNGDGTGSFTWTPDYTQAGSYDVTFRASDGVAVDSEIVTITVTNVNQDPVLAAIGAQSTDENTLLSFDVSASDPDGTIPTLSTSTLPTGATFTDNLDGTGTFNWTPDYSQAGTYDVTFRASDGVAVDSEIVTITVTDVNQAPVLASIGAQSTDENVLLTFGVSATDGDGTIPTLTTSTLPTGANFTDNGDGTGSFSWTPDYTQSGTYDVTFRAEDGLAVDSEVVTITVNNVNQDPILAAIGAQSTDENVLLTFNTSASDPDGTIPNFTTSTLPIGATFTDNLDGTGTFTWQPTYDQAGAYDVTFRATDGVAVDSEVVTITVNNVNQLPVLAAIGSKSTAETVNLNFGVSASDADGTTPVLTTSTLPTGATFTDNLDGTGTFDWTPGLEQSGSYSVTFYATDAAVPTAIDSEVVSITVTETNQAPVLAAIGAKSTDENVLLSFGVSASDPDGTIPTLTTSTLPTGATFTDNLDGTGTFSWTPTYDQAGTYDVTFRASDGIAVDSEVVTITVNNVNQPPVLAAIGPKSTDENVLLSFAVSASDADGVIPTLTTSTLPTGATFTDNGDGTGSFNWTPDYTQAGSYDVTFRASDGVAVDSEIVAITVTNVNRDPVLATIGPKSTSENVLLSFAVSASDPDGQAPALTTSTLPTGATFVDNGDGTGSFNWTPTYDQAGTYDVTFRASDGVAVDSEIVTITVTNINQAPVLASIGSQSTTENVLLSFGVSASDGDGQALTLTTSTLPTGASFTDNGDGTGSFSWTPTYLQSGSYSVTFRASDGVATDSEVVAITVIEAGNQLPVLASIGSQSTTENVLLSFTVSATDVESTPSFTTSTLPTGATFTDNGDGTGSFSWTPDYLQSGSYSVTFRAVDDSSAVDSEVVAITVLEAGNQLPVLASIGSQSTTEDVLLSFGVSATDIESTPTLTTSTLPTGASFSDNGDGTGSFSWTPDFTQAGIYDVTFYATDDSAAVDSEIVTITVNDAGNQAPVLAAIGAKSTTENVLLSFAISASDPDGITPTFSTSTLPVGASFIDNGDGTGSFTWTPTYLQSGSYNVTFRATDGTAIDSEVVAITVIEAGNQLPVLASIGSQSTTENVLLEFSLSATDAESTPSFTTSTLPTGATFIDNGNGTGTFSWTPTYLQSGSYSVTFRAVDDSLAVDSEVVAITVIEAGNQLPVLDPIGPQSTTEDVLLTFVVSATDIESTPALSALNMPSGANFVDNGDGTGAFSWTPTYTQAGTYNVTFRATDDSLATDDEIVTITVNEAGNQTPVLAAIGPQTTDENVLLTFGVSATDAETIPTLSTSALPTGATFTDNGDGTGSFSWTPTYTQSGSYNVTFTASDGTATDDEIVTITVNNVNLPPTLAAIGARSTDENVNLNFSVSATDPDGTIPALTTSTLPTGATFVDNGDGTGTFNWTPTYTDSGSYSVTFTASDGSLTDEEVVTITVNNVNRYPILASIGSKATAEQVNLNFGVSASDPDGDIPLLTTSTLPTGAIFTDNGNGTGTFDWTPDITQEGTYNVTFYATDAAFGAAVDSEQVTITVSNTNQEPVLATIGPKSTDENVNLNFGVSATDADGTSPALTTSTLPSGAAFVDNGDGTGTFDWTPTYLQSGSYSVTFYASDGIAIDSEIVAITVNDAGNQNPTLDPIGNKSITEGIALNFGVSSSDPESVPTLTTSLLPTGASFTDNGDGTGAFNWTPDYTQDGTYLVMFYATDDSLAVDSELVQIFVLEAGNQAPILDSIGPKTTTEDVNLNFTVTATDPDATIPGLSATGLPTGATFTDNGNGTGTFDWTPGFTDAGTYDVTFTATDGSLTDQEIVTITVLESGNQSPVLAAIGAQSTTENVLLSFGVSASDPDGQIPALSTSTLPTGATFVDNGDGTGSFDWTPTYTQAGTYDVTFYASDGALIDSEIVAITVLDAGNQTPVLDPIGPQATTEAVQLLFSVTASDPDATIPALSATNLPTGATFTDNGDGTGSFDWTPTYTQAGTYNVTFTASDGSLTDDEIVTITVNDAGNQAPVLDPIGAQSTAEGIALLFTVTSSDPDGEFPVLTTSTLPSGASFTDNGDGTGSFNWTPTYTQAGTYSVTFRASDGLVVDSEIVAITVTEAGNQAPVLDPIGPQATTEEVQLLFTVTASDPDATTPILSATNLPTGASFTDNGDGTGTFNWTPTFTQAGTYDVTFTASDGVLTDQEIVTITVNDAGNQAPILAAIGPKSTTENVLLSFAVSASDPDATTPSLSATNLPSGATFVDNGDGTGSFDWTPDFTQAGSYDVTFTASDGTLTDSEIVTITVNEAGNQTPVLAAIGAQSTTEDVLLTFGVSASDPDATIPALTTSPLPSGATFVDNGDGTGTFDWTPGFTQAGSYDVTFYASDGVAIDSEIVAITVNDAGNQAPVLEPIGPQAVTEETQLLFTVTASDPDATTPTLTATGLPTGATFIDNGNGTGTFDWTPTFTQAGTYDVTFTASDGTLTDQEIVTITVNDAGNQAPVLAAIGPQSTTENVLLTFAISASDPDATIPSLSATNLPTGATFVDNGDGTGSFSWTPGFTDAGTYDVTFTASDGTLTDSEIVTITVNDAGNQAPVLDPIGPQATTEEVQLLFTVTASDPDATIPALSATNLPTGASFVDNGDGTGTFDWTPTFTQAGTYDVTFAASDGSLIDDEIVTITVNDAGNQAPVLDSIGAQATTEDVQLLFAVTASDPDATIPALTATNLPTGAVFTDNGDGTGTFDWTPSFTDAGTYNVTFTASDGTLTDEEVVTITVADAGNQTPVLAAIGAQATTEDVLLTFAVSASDPDGQIPALSTSTLPAGATFVDNGDGTGSFNWTPDFTQAGSYSVTFYASDGVAIDSEVVAITVNEAGNQTPVLAAIGTQSTTENVLLTFGVSASDPDGATPTLTTSTLPTGAAFTDNGDGTGSFSWTPDFTQAGTYDVTFRASDGVAVDSEIVTITVLDAGNQAPVLASIGAQSTTENVLLTFGVSASDPDATIPTLSATGLPTGASFIDNGDGTGTFDWTPDFTQAGIYDVTFIASDGALSDSEIVTITVNDAGNQAPILDPIGPQAITEEVLLTFAITASDPDATIPALTATNVPTGATFIDNGDGTGSFNWTPTFTQAGVYNVTFTASDGTLSDSEVVEITVVDAGNQSPVLAAIGAQSTTESVQLLFSVSASDPDGTIPTLSTSTLPTGATFVDNGDGTGSFDWTPGFTQAGTYDVTFRASDGVAVDSEIVTITVLDAGNQSPVLDPIGPYSTTEAVQLLFGISASDPDETIPILSTSTLPTGALFTDNGDGTGTFDWTPDYTQAGVYNVTFYASDGVAVDSEVVVITVGDAGNQPPVLDSIGAQATTEGLQLLVAVTASDPDATLPTLSTSTLPTGATFVDNGDGTGVLDWTPGFTDAGIYSVTFYASDGVAIDSETVEITVVEAGNQPPVLDSIGPKTGTEAVRLLFTITGSDPDSTIPAFGAANLPLDAIFTDNGDGTATFNWLPGYTAAGTYNVTFFADDGVAADSEIVTITIADAGNQAPVLAAIGQQETSEEVQLLFTVTASDPDGTIPTLTTSALPTGALFTDNLDGTGTFDWTPGPTDAGSYNVTFYASDGVAIDSEIVSIAVYDVNQLPVLDSIPDQAIDEGVLLTLNVSASDVDGDIPLLSTSALPTGAIFTDSGNGTGTLSWTPAFDQAGTYTVMFYATDAIVSTAVDSQIVTITVNNLNRPPVLEPVGSRAIAEGSTLNFTAVANDPDGDFPVMTVSALPGTAIYTDNGDGTGTFNWATTFADAGTYVVTFYATDALFPTAVDSEVVIITVGEAGNQPPFWTEINDTTTAEGETLVLHVTSIDYESNAISLTVNTTIDAANYTFVDSGNGAGLFTYTPDYLDAGLDSIRFIATDNASPPLSSVMKVAVTTADRNQPPQFMPAGPFAVDALDTLEFTITAYDSTDVDSGRIFLSVSSPPTNAQFTDNGDNTGAFWFAPDLSQVGVDTVQFIAVDDDVPAQTSYLNVVITVRQVNQPPVLDSIGTRKIAEGEVLIVNLSATDPDGTIPFFVIRNAPENASLVDNGNGTGTWTFNPSFIQAGLYYVEFRASDGQDFDKETVLIQVTEAGDQTPYFTSVPTPSVTEGETLIDSVRAFDPDLDPMTLSVVEGTAPPNFTFTDNGDGTGIFEFSPDFTQSGTVTVQLEVAANGAADTTDLIITVVEFGNHDPALAFIQDQYGTETRLLTFSVQAGDVDGVIPILSTGPLPGTATFVDSANGKGAFRWTPSDTSAGIYDVMFYAIDGDPSFADARDSQLVTITIADTNRAPQVLALPLSDAEKIVNEGETRIYSMSATDADGTIPVLTAYLSGTDTLATNMTFVDSGNGKGVLTFSPDYQQGSSLGVFYNVVFQAIDAVDPTLLSLPSSPKTFIVYDVPQPPTMVFLPEGPYSLNEGDSLRIEVRASDPDGLQPTVRAENVPVNATVTSFGSRIIFNFRPDYSQAGVYTVRIIAEDAATASPRLADTALVDITVVEVGNQPPYWSGTYPDTVDVYPNIEDTTIVTAVDPDALPLTLTAGPLISGSNFIDNGDGTGYLYTLVDELQAGTVNTVTFTCTDSGGLTDSMPITYRVMTFLRGDADSNETYSLNDIVFLTNYLFRGGEEPTPYAAGDVDMSGAIDVSDLVYLINFLYKSGPRPPQ